MALLDSLQCEMFCSLAWFGDSFSSLSFLCTIHLQMLKSAVQSASAGHSSSPCVRYRRNGIDRCRPAVSGPSLGTAS